MSSATGQPSVRLGVIDTDSGFLHVLGNRLAAAGWPYRVLPSPVPLDALVRKLRQKLERASPGWRYLHTHFRDRLSLRGRVARRGRRTQPFHTMITR